MVGHGLNDGLRRAAGFLALLAVLAFVFLSAPSHAEPPATGDAPVAMAHHAGDGDLGGAQHPPGAHCASHCAGYAATPAPGALGEAGLPRPPQRYVHVDDAPPATLSASPPIRPPAA